MKIKILILQLLFFFLISPLFAFPGFSLGKKVQIGVYAGASHVFEYGSEEDYLAGGNDFPVTPSHNLTAFGGSLAYFFKPKFGIQFDLKYYQSTKITLEDPSDGDAVDIDTTKHRSITLSLIYQFNSKTVRPYLIVGGGIDKLSASNASGQVRQTRRGYPIEFTAPSDLSDAVIHGGAGLNIFLTSYLGINIEVRYVLLFSDPQVSSLDLTSGLVVRF